MTMAKKTAKRDIAAATARINDQIDLLDEIRETEGSREATACAQWGSTARRMADYIGLLIRAEAPLPDRLVKSWRYYGTCAWHAYDGLPAYLVAKQGAR
jgi:hypothetical protein